MDAIVGEWDILEFCYRINWFTNTCIEMSKINRLTPNINIQYTLSLKSSHSLLYAHAFITTSCTTQTCSTTHTQLDKPFICLHSVGVVFGEHEDSRSDDPSNQSDSEECF